MSKSIYPPLNDSTFLFDHYVTQEMTLIGIARIVGAKTGKPVRRGLERNNIAVRKGSTRITSRKQKSKQPIQGRTPMCTAALEAHVVTAMEAKIKNSDSFTAYDLTRDIRGNNPGEDVQHQDVRDAVKAAFRKGEMQTIVDRFHSNQEMKSRVKDFNGEQAVEYYFEAKVATPVGAATSASPAVPSISADPTDINNQIKNLMDD